MSLNLEQKKAVVAQVADQLGGWQAVVLAEYRGLTVTQMTSLRTEARNAGVYLRVVKNTLARRVVEGTRFECLQDHLVGPVILAGSGDPVAVAKVLSDFAKASDNLKVTVGAMNGEILDLVALQALAKLPSREELLARLIGTMQAPIQRFVQTLGEVPGRFVRTLATVRDERQSAEA